MNETTDEVSEESAASMADLARGLAASVDWEGLIATRPATVLAAAFGAGLVVSLAAGLWYRSGNR